MDFEQISNNFFPNCVKTGHTLWKQIFPFKIWTWACKRGLIFGILCTQKGMINSRLQKGEDLEITCVRNRPAYFAIGRRTCGVHVYKSDPRGMKIGPYRENPPGPPCSAPPCPPPKFMFVWLDILGYPNLDIFLISVWWIPSVHW